MCRRRRTRDAALTSEQTVLTIILIRVYTMPMIICVCKAVSDRRIRAAVKEGANSMRDLTRQLGLGTCCGKCLPDAKLVLNGCLRARDESAASVVDFPAAGSELLA